MKQILNIFIYYLSWHSSVTWFCRAGLALWVLAIVAKLISAQDIAYTMALLGYISLAGLPTLALPGIFRELITNKRLSLLPGFHFRAGLALLLLIVAISLVLPAFTTVFSIAGLAPGLAPWIFLTASLYTGYVQLCITSKHSVYLMGIGVWLSVSVLFYLKNTGIQFTEINPFLVATLVSFCLAVWCYALYTLSIRDKFKPIYRAFQDHEPFRKLWESHDRHPGSSTSAGTLLMGVPDGYRPLLKGASMWILVFPGTCAGLFAFFNIFIMGDALPPFTWSFITASAVLGGWNSIISGELAARSRLLWLRYGSDRKMLWRHMERVLLRTQAGIYFWALCVIAVMAVFRFLEPVILFNYFFFIFALSLFQLYLSLIGRIAAWPTIVKALLFILTMGCLIVATIRGFDTGDYFVLNMLELVLLALAMVMRQLARRRFIGIDWYQVQPLNLAAVYGHK